MFDLNYTDTLLTNCGVQSTSNTIANANTILYGRSHGQTNSSFTDSNQNYINEGSQRLSNWQIPASNFQSSQELNIGNRIKITISVPPKDLQPHSRIPLDLTIETKMPIEVSEQRPNHQYNIPQEDYKTLADLGGGVRDARPPLGIQILSISCSFRENLACSRSPGGFMPPLGKILDPPLQESKPEIDTDKFPS